MNDLMKKHFVNPQNMGRLKKATHMIKYKSGFCGDTIELYAQIENDVVIDVKYNVFGCYAAITSASIVSEWAMGKSVSELQSLSLEHVVEMMGGDVEPEKFNCVSVAVYTFNNIANNPI